MHAHAFGESFGPAHDWDNSIVPCPHPPLTPPSPGFGRGSAGRSTTSPCQLSKHGTPIADACVQISCRLLVVVRHRPRVEAGWNLSLSLRRLICPPHVPLPMQGPMVLPPLALPLQQPRLVA